MDTSSIEKKPGLTIGKMLQGDAAWCLVASLAAVYIPSLRKELVVVASLALAHFILYLPLLVLRSKDFVPENEPAGSGCRYYWKFSIIAAAILGGATSGRLSLLL